MRRQPRIRTITVHRCHAFCFTRLVACNARCNAIACRFACRFYFRVSEILRCVLRCQSVLRLSRWSRRNEFLFPMGYSRDVKRNEIPLVFSSGSFDACCKAETWNRRSIRRHSSRYALFRVSSVVVHNYWRDRETGVERRLLPQAHVGLLSEAGQGRLCVGQSRLETLECPASKVWYR